MRLRSLTLLLLWCAVAACGGSAQASGPVTVRLGYQPNLTHATALVGVGDGYFQRALGAQTTLKTSIFNSGPDEVEALFSNSIDAAFLGPNPAINAFVQSHGEAVRVVAGAASGGAGLVVRPSITSAAQLRGKTLASPQLGNTQDVALRYWLKQQGFATTTTGGGDVHVRPEDNSQTLTAFLAGQIDGAWVPEPWLSRMVVQGHGQLLVDERTQWPGGAFPTTVLVVRKDFLNAHGDTVKALLQGEVNANEFLTQHPQQAQADVNSALQALTTKSLDPAVLAAAWRNVTFTEDPLAAEFQAAAAHAHELGLLATVPSLTPMFDLGPLNQVLEADHLSAVKIR